MEPRCGRWSQKTRLVPAMPDRLGSAPMRSRIPFALALLALAACGPSRRHDGNGSGSGTSDGNTGCENTCSADLHQVLDCNGNPVMSCPDDQGCANGVCQDACQAAADSKSSIGCD